jgi:hypothetical protein
MVILEPGRGNVIAREQRRVTRGLTGAVVKARQPARPAEGRCDRARW